MDRGIVTYGHIREVKEMTKREYCETHPTVAVYSMGLQALSIHGIEYGIEDFIFWSYTKELVEWVKDTNTGMTGPIFKTVTTYHKSIIKTNDRGPYFMAWGTQKVYLDECLKVAIY